MLSIVSVSGKALIVDDSAIAEGLAFERLRPLKWPEASASARCCVTPCVLTLCFDVCADPGQVAGGHPGGTDTGNRSLLR